MRALLLGLCVFALCSNVAAEVIYLQPIQIREDDGSNPANASMELFEEETQKIWDQAGIELIWLSWSTFDDSSLLDLSVGDFSTSFEFGQMNADPLSYGGVDDGITINVWFADDLDSSSTFYGAAFYNSTSVVIGWDAVEDFNGGVGRLDTIAHEIGHTFDLRHDNLGAGGSENLMTKGSDRDVPGSIDDIFPDGLMYDQLNDDQIEEVLGDPKIQPDPVTEPGSLAFLLAGLAGVGIARRRRAA
jgi:hypothetical protein